MLKKTKRDILQEAFFEEYTYLLRLWGAGGTPLALGLCVYPLAQLTTFEGQQTIEMLGGRKLLDVAADLCKYVRDIQRKGIIHLDLKENNVLVDARDRVHLIDFGNANEEGRHYGLKYERAAPPPLAAAGDVHRAPSLARLGCFSAGCLLALISMEMEFPGDLGRIVLDI